jgi:hypothetical protein
MKEFLGEMKKAIWACVLLLLVGFYFGKVYATYSIMVDCKVLGMTRFGDTPMGCRVGEKVQ